MFFRFYTCTDNLLEVINDSLDMVEDLNDSKDLSSGIDKVCDERESKIICEVFDNGCFMVL